MWSSTRPCAGSWPASRCPSTRWAAPTTVAPSSTSKAHARLNAACDAAPYGDAAASDVDAASPDYAAPLDDEDTARSEPGASPLDDDDAARKWRRGGRVQASLAALLVYANARVLCASCDATLKSRYAGALALPASARRLLGGLAIDQKWPLFAQV
ncbi:hypothetical protein JL720_12190 [Aureococcus anophagefferens]|nr:hypothetical protein JL720_12190 [Aureococcus anophagefferens]